MVELEYEKKPVGSNPPSSSKSKRCGKQRSVNNGLQKTAGKTIK